MPEVNGRAWTAAEDAALLAAEVVPVADRTRCEGESDLQRLARELGRSEAAIASRRYKLMQRPEVREATERERKAAERVRRDRAIVAAVKAGATFHEAAGPVSRSKWFGASSTARRRTYTCARMSEGTPAACFASASPGTWRRACLMRRWPAKGST